MTVDLLTDEEYTKLKKTIDSKVDEIISKIFRQQREVQLSYFTNTIDAFDMKWITDPHLICERLLKEADISINLRCYDTNEIEAFESRAKQRAAWIAEYNKI